MQSWVNTRDHQVYGLNIYWSPAVALVKAPIGVVVIERAAHGVPAQQAREMFSGRQIYRHGAIGNHRGTAEIGKCMASESRQRVHVWRKTSAQTQVIRQGSRVTLDKSASTDGQTRCMYGAKQTQKRRQTR